MYFKFLYLDVAFVEFFNMILELLSVFLFELEWRWKFEEDLKISLMFQEKAKEARSTRLPSFTTYMI